MGDLVLRFGEASRSRDARGGAGPAGEFAAPRNRPGGSTCARWRSSRAGQGRPQRRSGQTRPRRLVPEARRRAPATRATDKALQSYQEALKLSEALAKADPNDAQAQRDLSVSYNKLGDVHLRLGATDQALQSYQRAWSCARRWPRPTPTTPRPSATSPSRTTSSATCT